MILAIERRIKGDVNRVPLGIDAGAGHLLMLNIKVNGRRR
jgi:hypothetical protein